MMSPGNRKNQPSPQQEPGGRDRGCGPRRDARDTETRQHREQRINTLVDQHPLEQKQHLIDACGLGERGNRHPPRDVGDSDQQQHPPARNIGGEEAGGGHAPTVFIGHSGQCMSASARPRRGPWPAQRGRSAQAGVSSVEWSGSGKRRFGSTRAGGLRTTIPWASERYAGGECGDNRGGGHGE